MIVHDSDSERGRLNYRVAGICVHAGQVLLHQIKGLDFWCLPGGRIEHLEDSHSAHIREMREELDVVAAVWDLRWVVENFFGEQPQAHELALYYRITLPEGSPYYDSHQPFTRVEGNSVLMFQWFPIDHLDSVRLFPTFLRNGLRALPTVTTHLIHRDPPD